ncbi:MAG: MBL fold metallo-hydrolase [Anaerolineae bacterium]
MPLEGFDVRGAVVVGATGTLVWDTLSRPEDMQPAIPLMKGPITVAYSHADWDHVGGTGGLEGVAAVVAHAWCAVRFADDVPRILERMRDTEPHRWGDVALVPPTLTFTDVLELDLGGVSVVLRPLPGHTPDSVVALLPEMGVLLAGDAVEAPLPTVERIEALPAWVAALDAWGQDPRVDTVVPGHGPIGGPELLADTAGYLRGLLAGNRDAPADMTPFYQDVHAANLRLARG